MKSTHTSLTTFPESLYHRSRLAIASWLFHRAWAQQVGPPRMGRVDLVGLLGEAVPLQFIWGNMAPSPEPYNSTSSQFSWQPESAWISSRASKKVCIRGSGWPCWDTFILRGPLHLRCPSRFSVTAVGYAASPFCASTFPTSPSVASCIYPHYKSSVQLVFCWLLGLIVLKFRCNLVWLWKEVNELPPTLLPHSFLFFSDWVISKFLPSNTLFHLLFALLWCRCSLSYFPFYSLIFSMPEGFLLLWFC